MKPLRLGSVVAIVLISIATLFSGLRFTRSALGNPAARPAALPAPHLGYGLNVWDQPQLMAGLGFDWIKLFEEAGPPPATRLPYRVLYRIATDGYPVDLADYLEHIRQLARTSRGLVDAFEFGNEPNLLGQGFWGMQYVNPELYADLLCRAYDVIKSENPRAVVVSGGLAPVGRTGPSHWNIAMDERVFTQRVLNAVKSISPDGLCMDAFGYHAVGFAYPPETDYRSVSNGFAFRGVEYIRDLMVAAGAGNLQIWNTEFGWIRYPASDPWIADNGSVSSYAWCDGRPEMSGFEWMRVTEQQQADYLIRAFQYADVNWPWMGPMFVWNLDLFYRSPPCNPQRFYALFHATDGDPNHLSPALVYAALTTMPKRPQSTTPVLTAQPDRLLFLTTIATPALQTQTLYISNNNLPYSFTWAISIETASVIAPLVTPLTGTNNATVSVSLDTSPIDVTGTYTANLIITANPSVTFGSPMTIPLEVIAVDQLQRAYLPIMARYATGSEVTSTLQLGLAFISSAEAPANETRYQRALAIDGKLNRWPMYWPNIEKNPVNQPRVFDWSTQDANIIADINHGFTILPILMLTPIGLDTGGSRIAPAPKVGDGLRLLTGDKNLDRAASPSSQGSPPQGLNLPIFSDNTDVPGPGKLINLNNRWAVFVNAAVNRYKPGGVLAQFQGWNNDKGIRHWEIWNEEDLNQFFSGTAADFARIQKVAYLAAKQADANATIVFGGMAHFEKPTWLGDVLNVIATDPMSTTYHGFMDAVASHNYSWAWQTFGYLLQDRQRLDARGLTGVKLWITETGLPVCNDPPDAFCPPPSSYRGTLSEQADFVIQTIVYAAWMNAEKVIWFQLYDDAGNDCLHDAFGLVRNPSTGPCTARDGTPRPAYDTYKVVNQLFAGVTDYWRQRPNTNQELIAFKRPATSERIIAMWTRFDITATVTLTATSSSAQLILPNGTAQTIFPSNGVYTISLPAATNFSTPTNDGSAAIGGSPRILIEFDPAAK